MFGQFGEILYDLFKQPIVLRLLGVLKLQNLQKLKVDVGLPFTQQIIGLNLFPPLLRAYQHRQERDTHDLKLLQLRNIPGKRQHRLNIILHQQFHPILELQLIQQRALITQLTQGLERDLDNL